MIRSLSILVVLSALVAPVSAAEIAVGETVLAYWELNDVYFVGTAVEKRGADYFVVYEDGDSAVVPGAKVRKYDLKVGSAVLARWEDDSYYPGKISKVVGRAFFIQFDDGDKGWVPMSGIAVK